MDHLRTIRSLRMQLLAERAIIGVVALCLIGRWACGYFSDAKSLIIVDGKPLVCVSTETDANAILNGIKNDTGCKPSDIHFRQDVCIARAPRDASPVSRGAAMRLARRAISPVVERWSVIADGKPLAAVPTKEEAGKVLDLARLRYGKLAKNLQEIPQFKQSVTVDIAAVSPLLYREKAEQAVELLFTAPKAVSTDAVYTVRSGDVAGAIAEHHSLRIRELSALNPEVDLNRLQIGDKIHVKRTAVPKAKLTVIVRDLETDTETIRSAVQRVSSAALYAGKSVELSPGRSGLRKVKRVVVYENGHRVGSEILDEEIIREPRPRRIAVGIKPRPTW